MKNSLNLTFDRTFFCALLGLIAISFFVTFTQDSLLLKSTMALFIPAFLIFYLLKYKTLGVIFISFLLFTFLGDLSLTFFSNEIYIKVSSILYFLSYLYLIAIVMPKFKLSKIDKLIGLYLLGVFVINVFFLYTLYSVLKVIIPDQTEVLLFGLKSLALIILAFISFGVYLNTQTKQSILFLVAAIFIGFSTILNYVNLYYLYHWSFELLYRGLYAVGLYFIFKYMIVDNRYKATIYKLRERYSSDNILA
ncbi:hypothetical protein Q4Q34_19545 [Flavivirga abyssicola]|uniref:hypothetical protein n=1 Tax=Flavivirga abyssicola TaxID=3063533 RepID=UPI0026E071FD|nr:hypothetical protein [Flavivirga sp. MEBiC07777]WVK13412.1 hypothetical protein Q4Q34_19545 [Flavivirga sp. MEBiC07777]